MRPLPSSTQPPRSLPRWGAPPAPVLGSSDRARAGVIVLGPALLVGLGIAATFGPGWGLAALAALVAAAGGWVRVQDRLALRAAGAEPLAADRHPRAHNLAAGLARQLGVPGP